MVVDFNNGGPAPEHVHVGSVFDGNHVERWDLLVIAAVAAAIGLLAPILRAPRPLLGGALVACGVGVICGLVNGLVVAYGRVPSIVVTLGTPTDEPSSRVAVRPPAIGRVSHFPPSAVAVCAAASLFCQVMVSPTCTMTVRGWNANPLIVTPRG